MRKPAINKSKIKSIISSGDADKNNIDLIEAAYAQVKRDLEIERIRNENEARKGLSINIFTVTVMWMVAILIIVIAVGKKDLFISDSVLIALITTTTANVFGFMYIVAKYLFNQSKST